MSGFGTYGSDWLTVVSLPQQDLLSSLGTGAAASNAPTAPSAGPGGLGGDSQKVIGALLGAAKPVSGHVGQRHAAADQPGLDADDRRQGLHRRGRAERAVRRGRAHVLMTAEALAISSEGLTKRFRGPAGGRPHRPGGARGARSTASSARTGRARPPRSACCSAWPTRPAVPRELLGVPMPDGTVSVLSRVGSLVEGPAFYPYLSGWDNLARYDAADRSAVVEVGGGADRSGPGAGRPDRGGEEEVPELLARHEAAAGHRGRPAAAPRADHPGRADQRARPAGHPRGPRARQADRRGRDHRVRVLAPAGRGRAGVLARRRDAGRQAGVPGLAARAAPHGGGPHHACARRTWRRRPRCSASWVSRTPAPGEDTITAELGTAEPELICAELVHAGVGVRGLSVESPSLEELFVGLTGEGFDVDH